MKRMAVVIVNYRTAGMVGDLLGTLLPQVGEEDVVVVVENGSGELEKLRAVVAGASRVEVVASEKNLGFAGANNLGIRKVEEAMGGAAFYMLLNPDTLMREGAVAGLMGLLERRPDVALVGPRLEYPDGKVQLSAFGDPTPVSELVRGANFGPLSKMLKRWEVYGKVQEEGHWAQWLAGACVLMRREVVEQVGLLDDGFFMYFEEVDYFRRARKAGLRAWYEPGARVVHLVGQASGVTTEWGARRLPAYWFESRHRYFRKHFGYGGMVMADGMWFMGHVMMRVRRAVTGVSHSAVARGEASDFVRHAVKQAFRVTT